jgi:hypothetical protein
MTEDAVLNEHDASMMLLALSGREARCGSNREQVEAAATTTATTAATAAAAASSAAEREDVSHWEKAENAHRATEETTVAENNEKTRKKQYGPFLCTFAVDEHELFDRCAFREYPDYEIIDRNSYAKHDMNDPSQLRLEVGDRIKYTTHGSTTLHLATIHDFGRGLIFTGPCEFNVIQFPIKAKRNSITTITRIREAGEIIATDPAKIWVLRNPNLTHTMTEEGVKIYEGLKMGDEHFKARAVPGFGFGNEKDKKWRCLNDLPTAAPIVPIVAPSTSSVYPCFICGEDLKTLPNQPRWIDVPFDFYGYRKRGKEKDPAVSRAESRREKVMLCLMKHCNDKHPRDMFHFLHKAGLNSIGEDEYTIQIHLQKVFRKGLEARGQLEFSLFQEAMENNNPVPLKFALCNLFGNIKGHLQYAQKDIKQIGKYVKYHPDTFLAFTREVSASLKKIEHDFLQFDFRQVQDGVSDKEIMRIWNAVNLFFRRGMFNDKPFLAIRNVKIPEKTLEVFAEEMKDQTLETLVDTVAQVEPPTKKKRAAKRSNKKMTPATQGGGADPNSEKKGG